MEKHDDTHITNPSLFLSQEQHPKYALSILKTLALSFQKDIEVPKIKNLMK